MPKSLPVIIVNGKNITAQFEAPGVPSPKTDINPQLEAAKKDLNLSELDYYKLALIGAAILLSI